MPKLPASLHELTLTPFSFVPPYNLFPPALRTLHLMGRFHRDEALPSTIQTLSSYHPTDTMLRAKLPSSLTSISFGGCDGFSSMLLDCLPKTLLYFRFDQTLSFPGDWLGLLPRTLTSICLPATTCNDTQLNLLPTQLNTLVLHEIVLTNLAWMRSETVLNNATIEAHIRSLLPRGIHISLKVQSAARTVWDTVITLAPGLGPLPSNVTMLDVKTVSQLQHTRARKTMKHDPDMRGALIIEEPGNLVSLNLANIHHCSLPFELLPLLETLIVPELRIFKTQELPPRLKELKAAYVQADLASLPLTTLSFSAASYHGDKLTLGDLPASLTNLSLPFGLACKFADGGRPYPPNLLKFRAAGVIYHQHELAQLPLSLEELCCSDIELEKPVPAYHMDASGQIFDCYLGRSEENYSLLIHPAYSANGRTVLKTSNIRCAWTAGHIGSVPSVTALRVAHSYFPWTALADIWNHLPKNLVTLLIDFTKMNLRGTKKILPATLTRLKVSAALFSLSSFQGLPQGLKHLKISNLKVLRPNIVKALPPQLETFDVGCHSIHKTAISLLPRSITSLSLNVGPIESNCLYDFPPKMVRLYLALIVSGQETELREKLPLCLVQLRGVDMDQLVLDLSPSAFLPL